MEHLFAKFDPADPVDVVCLGSSLGAHALVRWLIAPERTDLEAPTLRAIGELAASAANLVRTFSPGAKR